MTGPAARLAKPAYLLRPDQLVRRVVRRRRRGDRIVVRLPWGARIAVSSADVVGRGILRSNVHELAVTEVMWRLTDPDDLALDVGANAGYFSALLAVRAREVVAFEAHPRLAERLRATSADLLGGRVEVRAEAVSDRTGTARLAIPAAFADNEGTASLADVGPANATVEVPTVRLDDVVGDRGVGMLKIDVEGHEPAALAGLERALGERRVRDVIFEEHAPFPTPVSALLERHGFTLFSIGERFAGAVLGPPDAPHTGWDAPTFLATLDPERARRRVRPDGWHALRPRGRHLPHSRSL